MALFRNQSRSRTNEKGLLPIRFPSIRIGVSSGLSSTHASKSGLRTDSGDISNPRATRHHVSQTVMVPGRQRETEMPLQLPETCIRK